MASAHITPPEKFEFQKPEEWRKWIRRFERYRIAAELNKKDEELQVNTLLYTMGDEADDIMMNFAFENVGDDKKYKIVKEKFDGYFVIRKNTIYERAVFNQRRQAPDETVEAFVTALHCLAEHCEYGVLRDEMIRDRIVVGLKDSKLSEKLQMDSELTLKKAVQMARQSELVKKQQETIRNSPGGQTTGVDAVAAKTKRDYKRVINKPQSLHKTGTGICQRCGNNFHSRHQCPAKDATCHKCGKTGHFAKCCKSERVHEIRASNHEFDSDDHDDREIQEVFLGEISDEKDKAWRADIEVNKQTINFKLDSGADVTVISKQTYDGMRDRRSLTAADKKLYGPCKHRLKCYGKFAATLRHNDSSCKEELYVIDGLERPLLSRSACMALGTITKVDSIESQGYDHGVKKQFPKLFQGLGCMKGEYEIRMAPETKPFNLTTPRRIPVPLLPKVKHELQRMETLGVIEKVDQPTEWCSPVVVVPKSNGKVRICGDFIQLNKGVLRENHPMPTTEQTLAKLAGAKVVSKLDANSGFWQRCLKEESRLLTTFITPWGRYCYKRLPFGISSAPEHFQKTMQRILDGLEGVECQMDDILVYGETQEQHDERLTAVLKRLEEASVTLNPDKCEFSKEIVVFLGYLVGKAGIQLDPSKVEAITQMKEPTDISELRRFLGMVNQMGKHLPHLADKTKPLRDLMSQKNSWLWGQAQKTAFQSIIEALSSTTALAIYDPNKETRVSADASSYGLGAVMTQRQANGDWRAVAYISRALTPVEQRYAQIEKEALATTWACERLSDYLIGKEFHVETDHKPLIPILGSKNLDEMPPRIQRLRLRLMRFHYTISHVPGKSLVTADTLSRAPVPASSKSDLQDEINLYVDSIMSGLPASDKRLQEIMERQEEDEVCRQIRVYCQEGWPDRNRVPGAVKPFWSEKDEITTVKGLLMKNSRIIIPSCMRLEILDYLHEGHQGITKCRERAKMSVWWPGLSRQIEDLISRCRKCAEHRVYRPEPLIPSAVPDRPWQVLGTDLLSLRGLQYLLVVDYFSRYIEVAILQSSQTSREVIRALKSIFARHGIPEMVRSDNGPQYNSAEFTKFAKDWGFNHVTSSPKFPQSNGGAERAVQTAKGLLKKEVDSARALMAYRSTPLENGFSPAELLFGRKLRTTLPIASAQLQPKWPDLSQIVEREEVHKEHQKANFDTRHRVQSLPEIPDGERVWIRDMKVPAQVIQKAQTPRSYVVDTPTGTIRRNRRDLVPLSPPAAQANWKNLEPPGKPTPTKEVNHPDTAQNTTPAYARTRSGRVVVPPIRLDL